MDPEARVGVCVSHWVQRPLMPQLWTYPRAVRLQFRSGGAEHLDELADYVRLTSLVLVT